MLPLTPPAVQVSTSRVSSVVGSNGFFGEWDTHAVEAAGRREGQPRHHNAVFRVYKVVSSASLCVYECDRVVCVYAYTEVVCVGCGRMSKLPSLLLVRGAPVLRCVGCVVLRCECVYGCAIRECVRAYLWRMYKHTHNTTSQHTTHLP